MEEIVEGVWEARGDMYIFNKVHFPIRMLAIRLTDGSLLLHSPIPIDDELESSIRALGEVKYVIAPNLFHHVFVKKTLARFPDAELYGAPGFDEKRSDLPFKGYLDKTKPFPWSDIMPHTILWGAPQLNECVFFHKPSQSLIVTDLVFNIQKSHNFRTDMIYRFFGTYRKLAQSKLFRRIAKDKEAIRESTKKIIHSWEPKRLIMAHGEIYEGDDVKEKLQHAMRWLGDLSADA